MRTRILGFGLMLVLVIVPGMVGQTPFPCATGNCMTVGPIGRPQGWIVGEIRAFAFGDDSKRLLDQMAQLGWVECAGQSAIRGDFDELWRVIGTNWGNLDRNTFLLPDLRGVFMRGLQHSKVPPPDQATHVPPYTGDVDVKFRIPPRPEAGNAGGSAGSVVNGNFVADHVGSVQAGNVGQHSHPFSYDAAPQDVQHTYDPGNRDYLTTYKKPVSSTTGVYPSGQNVQVEDHPSNAFVMYFIYVGKPAQVIQSTAKELEKGPLATDRIECYKKSGKCRTKMED